METNGKIKKTLKKFRLLGLVRFIFTCYNVSKNNVISFFYSFKMYLFNDWLTFFPSNTIRIFYLRYILATKIGKSCFIHMGCRFEGKISIGNNSVIGRGCILKGEIVIKSNVSITSETYIFTSSHMVNDPDFNCYYKPVIIEDYAWIGARAMILPGVNIGKGAVVGATSTVTKNIPDYSIFAGVPAKLIGVRSKDLNYTLDYSPYFQ